MSTCYDINSDTEELRYQKDINNRLIACIKNLGDWVHMAATDGTVPCTGKLGCDHCLGLIFLEDCEYALKLSGE